MRRTVEAGYDRIAQHYLASKDPSDPLTLAALEALTHDQPQGLQVLDLGCGAGIPVTQWFAQRHDRVTGVDVSARQLELAQEHVPEATFIKSDMTEVSFATHSFDIIVAFYFIHVPKLEQPALVNRIYAWLKPGGTFLATWAMSEWEGEEQNWEGWGAPMSWSHYDADANLAMLRDAQFTIQSAEPQTSGDETWLWVVARKDHA